MTDVPGGRRRLDHVAAGAAVVMFAVSIYAYAVLAARYPKQYWVLEDLDVYQLGGNVALHSGPLYTEGFRANHLPFLYPPFAALLFTTVASIKFTTLKFWMTAANILSVMATAWLAFGLAGTRDRERRLAGTLFISALAMWLDPVAQTLSFGQINLLLMLLVLADLSLADRRWWKGSGTGIAAGIKLTPLIFSAYLLISRRFRAFAVSVAALAATMVISFVFLPGQSTQYWIDGKFNQAGNLGSGYGGNQSLYGMIRRLMHNGSHAHTVWLAVAVIVAAGGLALSVWAHRRGDELLAVSVAAITGLLVSPISWNHHWVWAVPVMVWAFARFPRELPGRSRPVAWLLGAAVFAVFVAVPKHLTVQAPIHPAVVSSQPDPGPLAHLTGWIWLMPTYGNDGYYWSGTQIIVGNLYVVFGLVFLLAVFGYLALRRAPAPAPATSREELAPA